MSESYHPTADQLEDFAARSLEAGDRVVVESHLLACPACQTRVEEWDALFSALSGMPMFEPSVGFANRVMLHVRVAPRAQWQQWADRATALAARVAPRTNYGWSVAVAFLALPVLLGGSAIAWLVSRSYITPETLLGYTRATLAEGLQAFGSTAINTVMQTNAAGWVVANATAFIGTAGLTGVGAVVAAAGAATVLSAWVLYRNLFRSRSRESDYAMYSF